MFASQYGYFDIVKLLIENNANVNIQDNVIKFIIKRYIIIYNNFKIKKYKNFVSMIHISIIFNKKFYNFEMTML
jgi:hypothetical protein